MLIFGAGFLGTRLSGVIPGAVMSRADIADPAAVRLALAEHRPEVVINAAGATGRPNVDALEGQPHRAARSNTVGPLVLAEAAERAGAWLLHLASGCVFYGPSPHPAGWREDDPANPISLYARTRYASDLVLSGLPGVCVLRLRMPIDGLPGPRNLITKVAGYTHVMDVQNSVTVLADLDRVVTGLITLRPSGVLHATNPGVLSHRHLLARYRAVVDPQHTCEFVSEDALLAEGLIQKPRSNAILNSERLAGLGLAMRPVADALEEALQQYAPAWAALRSTGR